MAQVINEVSHSKAFTLFHTTISVIDAEEIDIIEALKRSEKYLDNFVVS